MAKVFIKKGKKNSREMEDASDSEHPCSPLLSATRWRRRRKRRTAAEQRLCDEDEIRRRR